MMKFPSSVAPGKHVALRILIALCACLSSSLAHADGKIAEYTDNEYDFAFQFPADWRMQKLLPPTEIGEIRVIVKHPTATMYVEAIVGKLDKTVTKEAL